MTISETTLSDMMFSTVPGKRFRMLVFIMGDVICASRNAWVIGSNEKEISHALALSNITAGVRERVDANRTREITPLCGKPKSREQSRCTSGSISRVPR